MCPMGESKSRSKSKSMSRTVTAFLCLLAFGQIAEGAEKVFLKEKSRIFVDNVWAGCPVGYAMTIRNGKQYIAYYDAERWMTIAWRSLDSREWHRKRLDDQIGWDAHNYIALAFDSEGYIHVSGNMHGHPLRYYRSTEPEEIDSIEGVHRMTGELEGRCTYPRFYSGPKSEFLFTYRDGGSGNGSNIINVYDARTRTWKRHIDKPIFDGEGLRNAYQTGPARDRNGIYHLAWVWRDTPDCATNHDVSYAQSPDLVNWRKSDGTPLPLPLTLANSEVIDRVQVGEGLMNSEKISFDDQGRVMVTYIKFDPKGKTQVYTMRREGDRWKRYQTTDWPDRWEFSGGGTVGGLIGFSGPSPWVEPNKLYQTFTNRFTAPYARIRFLDPKTLQQIGEPMRIYPASLDTPAGSDDEWQVNIGGVNVEAIRRGQSCLAIRWETLRANRDRPREQAPPPSKLEIVELVAAEN